MGGDKAFQYLMDMPEFHGALKILFYRFAEDYTTESGASGGFALMLNEVRVKWFENSPDAYLYPLFSIMVVLGGILIDFLSPDGGMVNSVLKQLQYRKFILGT